MSKGSAIVVQLRLLIQTQSKAGVGGGSLAEFQDPSPNVSVLKSFLYPYCRF